MPENEPNCPLVTNDAHVNPAPQNLLIIDGECGFCKRWALYFQQIAPGRFQIGSSQEAGPLFPQITQEQFAQSVKFIDTGGAIYHGAEACFRALSLNPVFCFLVWFYQGFQPFARCSEAVYRVVASNRMLFSKLTLLFWGEELNVSRVLMIRSLFLRGLGIVYLIAFLSLIPQMLGLFGSQGVMPVAEYARIVEEALAQQGGNMIRFWYIPSVFWYSQSDTVLMVVLWLGVVAALFLVINIAPAIAAAICFVLYLSICAVGEPFMGFQWDALLLEMGFLAIFFAPWKLFPGRGQFAPAPSRVIIWLYRWLLFRLMFASAVVKLSSGDKVWADWRALDFHYFTQPIPNPVSWYAHQLPRWFQEFSVGSMFFIELVVPFFIFAPRRLRFGAGGLLAFLQVLIILTGNYTFFNWLTLLLVLTCWDDQALEWFSSLFRNRRSKVQIVDEAGSRRPCKPEIFLKRWIIIPALAVLVTWMSIAPLVGAFRINSPQWVSLWNRYLGQFRIVNGYGLFAVMTTERREIVIEGSHDGVNWLPYEFKYKPGDVNRLPPQIAPFQPRLDWQMWFASLGDYQANPWLLNLQGRILEGSQPVCKLLGRDPFAGHPPRYIRAILYDYKFTTPEEHKQTGAWWSRKLLGPYNPTLERRSP